MGDRYNFVSIIEPGFPPSHPGPYTRLSSGLSGFPFPWREISAATATGSVIGPMPRATVWRNYWRLRQWRITGTLAMSFNNGGVGYTATTTLNSAITLDTLGTITREWDLRRQQALTGTFSGSWSSTFGGGTTGAISGGFALFGDTVLDLTGTPTPPGRLFRNPADPTQHWITAFVSLTFDGLESTFPGPGTAALAASTAPPFTPAGGTAVDIDGFPITIDHDGNQQDVTSCSLAIAPDTAANSYWEWAKPDGSPKFDSSTGALL